MDTEGYLYRAADFVSQVLPHRFAYWCGLRVADAFWHWDRRGREAVISNLRHIHAFRGLAVSEDVVEREARRTFHYFGKYLVDFFRFTRMSMHDVKRTVSTEHVERIEQAVGMGRGVLVVTAHLGNWEIGGAALAAMGYPVNGIFMPTRSKKTNALFQRRREARGLKVFPLGEAARESLKALRRKEFVGLLGDRDYSGGGARVPLFGVPTRLPSGPARLCLKTGAPILMGFLLRRDDDTFLMRIYPPITAEEYGSISEIQGAICDVLEQAIGEDPCQWFMFDEFWQGHRAGDSD